MRARASLLAFAIAIGAPGVARAQLHWDAGLQGGVMKRILVARPAGVPDAGFGPIGELHAHVAVLPLVRAGAYLSYESSPQADPSAARTFLAYGVRAKVTPPFLLEPWHSWAFLGFGYASGSSSAFQRSFTYVAPDGTTTPATVNVDAADGSMFEIPFGVGASYTFLKPLAATAELGARLGFLHGQDLYRGRGFGAPGFPRGVFDPLGKDFLGISLTLGIMAEL